MKLHITPSFNIDRLCKTASVLLFLVHLKMYEYVNRSVFIQKRKIQVFTLSGFKVMIQKVHVQFLFCYGIEASYYGVKSVPLYHGSCFYLKIIVFEFAQIKQVTSRIENSKRTVDYIIRCWEYIQCSKPSNKNGTSAKINQ